MTAAPDRYAVFGQPIAHSKSPRIHGLFAEQTAQAISYTAQEVAPEQFADAVHAFFADGGKGLNCTVPLKELAWQLADRKTPRAELSRAVNALVLEKDGSILGENTDGIGLVADLTRNHEIDLVGSRILVIGAGGASRGIIGPLLEQSPESLVIVNRTVFRARQIADEFRRLGPVSSCGFEDLRGQHYDLIINATSTSLSNQLPPLPDGLLTDTGSCYDLAYGNAPTTFVLWGREQHARYSLDGLGMLVEQAAEAFYLWRGVRPETRPVIDLLDAERKNSAG